MSPAYNSSYSINGLQLQVHLGCSPEERKQQQRVEVDIRFYYPELPPESQQDDLEAYICHGEVATEVLRVGSSREFQLVEFLGMELFRAVRALLRPEVKLWLRATKCDVMMEAQLEGGTSFTHTDLPAGAWTVPE